MGLETEEFWRLTPRQFKALVDRLEQKLQREDYRPALICSVLANINRGKRKKPYTPKDFMPGSKYKGPTRPTQSPQQMLAFAEMLNTAFHGEDKRKAPTKWDL